MKAILSVLLAGMIHLSGWTQSVKLNSYPPAQAVIFLDFDGQYVQGTSWNWGGPINAQASGLSSAAITEIFNRVAEDYRIFNINITTDSTVYASAPINKRTRVIITPTYQWYGAAGGVAYVGSFTWGDDTPAWVFSGLLNNNVKNIAEAASHEAGHTLGLQHQSSYDVNCIKTAEYSSGQGSGEISWAPIMGVGYYRNSTTWHNGPNAYGCTSFQSDIDIIAGSPNNIGLRSDEHGNNHSTATAVTVLANNFQASGIINNSPDKDVFRLDLAATNHLSLSANPQSVGSGNAGANVDIRVTLLDQNGDTLSRYNPSNLLNAGVDTNLNSGTYYIVVEGVANAFLADYGSLGYYSINGSLAGVLPVNRLQLFGRTEKNKHRLNWIYEGDETIKQVEIQSSANGVNFKTIDQIGSEIRSYEYSPFASGAVYYRIRLVSAADEKTFYSNIIVLKGEAAGDFHLLSTIVKNDIRYSATKEFHYQLLDQRGSLLQNGRIMPGNDYLPVANIPQGLFILRVVNSSGSQSFKLIKQ